MISNGTVICQDGRLCHVEYRPQHDCREYLCSPCEVPCNYETNPYDSNCRFVTCGYHHFYWGLIPLFVLLILAVALGKSKYAIGCMPVLLNCIYYLLFLQDSARYRDIGSHAF